MIRGPPESARRTMKCVLLWTNRRKTSWGVFFQPQRVLCVGGVCVCGYLVGLGVLGKPEEGQFCVPVVVRQHLRNRCVCHGFGCVVVGACCGV